MKYIKKYNKSTIQDFLDSEYLNRTQVINGSLVAEEIEGRCPQCKSSDCVHFFDEQDGDFAWECKDCKYIGTYFDVVGYKFIPKIQYNNMVFENNPYRIWMTLDNSIQNRYLSLNNLDYNQINYP